MPSFCTIITVKYSLDTLFLLPQPYILLFTAVPQVLCIVEAGDCMPVSRYILMHFLRPCGRTHLATES